MDLKLNPLIAEQPVDTYINVLSALSALKVMQDSDDTERLDLSPRATLGRSLLMSCTISALDYEQNRSQKPE